MVGVPVFIVNILFLHLTDMNDMRTAIGKA